jgi:hypothetical protein
MTTYIRTSLSGTIIAFAMPLLCISVAASSRSTATIEPVVEQHVR